MIKEFKLLLILGIFFLIIGFISSSLVNTPTSINENTIVEFLFKSPAWIILLYTLIIAPLSEEFIFRFWAAGKNKARIVSLFLITVFVSIAVNLYWAVGFALIYNVTWFLTRKKPLAEIYALAIITAFFFTLCHSGNLEFKHFIIVSPVYMGLSLILTYIILRFKFIYAVLGHLTYNALLLAMSGFFYFPVNAKPQIFENEGTVVSLQRVSVFEKLEKVSVQTTSFSENGEKEIISDSIFYSRASLAEIAASLFEEKKNFKIEVYPNNYEFYRFTAQSNQLGGINKEILFNNFAKKMDLILDTLKTKEKIYYLSMKKIPETSEGVRTNLILLSKTITELTGIKVSPKDDSDKQVMFCVNIDLFRKNKKNFDKVISILEKDYGIQTLSREEEIYVIRIFEQPE